MTRLEQMIKRGVVVLDTLPEGWQEVKGAMTAPRGYYWAEKRVSRFSPQHKTALIKKGA